MTQAESDIIIRCQGGGKDAFRWVVNTYQQMVFSLALKMLCDEDEAKDIVQEIFIRVWLSMRDYDTQRTFTTWLYTIASRLCLDRLKRKTHIVVLSGDERVLRRIAGTQTLKPEKIPEGKGEELFKGHVAWFTRHFDEGDFKLLSLPKNFETFDEKRKASFMALYEAKQKIRKRLKELGYG